jgi:hypothetical protein
METSYTFVRRPFNSYSCDARHASRGRSGNNNKFRAVLPCSLLVRMCDDDRSVLSSTSNVDNSYVDHLTS